jgi:hypothetical protein
MKHEIDSFNQKKKFDLIIGKLLHLFFDEDSMNTVLFENHPQILHRKLYDL